MYYITFFDQWTACRLLNTLYKIKRHKRMNLKADVENKGPENLTSHLEVQLQAWERASVQKGISPVSATHQPNIPFITSFGKKAKVKTWRKCKEKKMSAFVRSCQFFLLEVYEAWNSSFLMFSVQVYGLIIDQFHFYKAWQQMTLNQIRSH